jgi:hypothetical protein
MLDRIWRAYSEKSSPTYGYGFAILETPVGRAAGHAGDFSGISADFQMHLDAGYTMAVLSNYGADGAVESEDSEAGGEEGIECSGPGGAKA